MRLSDLVLLASAGLGSTCSKGAPKSCGLVAGVFQYMLELLGQNSHQVEELVSSKLQV